MDRRRVLLVASDLQDNVRFTPELNLNDAQVAVVGFQPFPDPKKTQKLKKRWTRFFIDLGARATRFFRADEAIQLNQL